MLLLLTLIVSGGGTFFICTGRPLHAIYSVLMGVFLLLGQILIEILERR
jgi:hypothetical protein